MRRMDNANRYRDAATLLNSISQDKPRLHWRDCGSTSPDFLSLMENVEIIQNQQIRKNTSVPDKFHATVTTAPLKQQELGLEDGRPFRAIRWSDVSGEGGRRSEPSQSPLLLSALGSEGRKEQALAAAQEALTWSRRLQAQSHDRDLASRFRIVETRDVISLLEGDDNDEEPSSSQRTTTGSGMFDISDEDILRSARSAGLLNMNRNRTEPRGLRFGDRLMMDHSVVEEDDETASDNEEKYPDERDEQVESVEEEGTDEDERLARQLMEEEQQAFLHSLYNRQQEELDRLRNDGTLGNGFLEDSTEETVERQEEQASDMSYDQLLELGERLGDVRTERWRQRSAAVAARLCCITFRIMQRDKLEYKDDLCVICQFQFEPEDEVKLMPNCRHAFHKDCCDQWIAGHDKCATCKANVE